MERFAMLGFAEIVGRLPELLKARATLLAEFERFRPHVVLLVDYPGFNLRIGPQLKRRGARVFYYIAPQVWAWHPERAREMAEIGRGRLLRPGQPRHVTQIGRYAGGELGGQRRFGDRPEVDEPTFRAEPGSPRASRAGAAARQPLAGSAAACCRRSRRRRWSCAAPARRSRPSWPPHPHSR
jgi:hypothetical protein